MDHSNYSIDKKVYNFILSQPEQVKKSFLEILDQIPVLLEKINKNLQANAFETALETKNIITNYISTFQNYAMQYHKVFGIQNKIWSDDEVKMIINEGKRLYGLATDLIVNKLHKLSSHEYEHEHEHKHGHVHI